MTIAITVQNVIRTYGVDFTLNIDELHVHAGDFFCLMGPTGCGKSTLLRVMAGVEPIHQGEILLQGEPFGPSANAHNRRHCAMVFQKPQLLSRTVRQNIEYGLRIRGTRADFHDDVSSVMNELQLTPLANRRAHTLSGGQAQLTAIARALVLRPDLLLLDEPTANLDPARVALVEQTLQRFCETTGSAVIMATHNIFQARRLAKTAGLLLNGKMIEIAPNVDFFHSPQDPRTTAFVEGKMVY